MTAVLFIIFNRPATTQKVFEAIRVAKPSRLYIAADAPREGNTIDEEKCKATRAVTEHIDWPCDVKRLYQENNLGCSVGPRTAFSWFFSQEKEGIILEDDCVPHPDFFLFAATMLEKYRDNKQIISINGSNLGYELKDGNSYSFSRFMNMWGWATWADRAASIDYSLHEWKKIKRPLWFLYINMRQHLFDTDINWYRYWQHKFDLTVTKEKITWWDWQWIFHQLKHQQLSIVPAVNLVSNIGFDADATHTHEAGNPAANIPTTSLRPPFKHPASIQPDFIYEEQFVKWVWCFHKRLPTSFYLKQFIATGIFRRKMNDE
jgi:hypothetical protein